MMLDYKYCPQLQCRWSTYQMYKLILIVSMLNEMSIVLGSTEIGISAYYIFFFIYLFAVIFIGIPLVYSQICIAQYTNCNVVSLWNCFPLFRGFGFGLIFLIFMKTIYLSALSSWYLEYSFHAALDPPPWSNCEYFNNTKCLVKRINLTIFQHCIEANNFFKADCGMITASGLFYMTEIGGNSTYDYLYSCFTPWKPLVAATCIHLSVYLLSFKKLNLFQIGVKIVIFYLTVVILVLFCIALSSNGSWFTILETVTWQKYHFPRCNKAVYRAILMLGSGSGILIHLSRDVSFRSPATITSISSSLVAVSVSLIMGLVIFSGVKNMSYYHGEESNILELNDGNDMFNEFASVSEILSYYNDGLPLWGFAYFSVICVCLFLNLWLHYDYFSDILSCYIHVSRKYIYLYRFLITLLIFFLSWPFYCTDIFASLTDLIEILQLLTCLMFSIALYWFYGYKRHADDINFMLGVKSSYYWRTTWAFNPLLLCICFYGKFYSMSVSKYSKSYKPDRLNDPLHKIVLYALIALYLLIVSIGTVIEVMKYYSEDKIVNILSASNDWGPKDGILFKSRQMFIPEIMTTEFLYRQVRIRGYKTKRRITSESIALNTTVSSEKVECSALTSN